LTKKIFFYQKSNFLLKLQILVKSRNFREKFKNLEGQKSKFLSEMILLVSQLWSTFFGIFISFKNLGNDRKMSKISERIFYELLIFFDIWKLHEKWRCCTKSLQKIGKIFKLKINKKKLILKFYNFKTCHFWSKISIYWQIKKKIFF